MEIKELIKSSRVESGFTQEKAAEELNVSRQTISNWENDKSLPDIISILKMSDLYHISLDELLKGDKKMVEKIKNDASYEEEQKKYLNYSFITMVILLIIEVLLLLKRLSVADISLSYYLNEMYDAPFIVMALACIINTLLYRIADKKKSRFIAKIPVVIMIGMILYVAFDMVLSIIGLYRDYGILVLVGAIILLIVVAIATEKISDYFNKKSR